uniref:Uncharacterized protein n=1 Tax=Sphaerodactylus townsendi TaxID=933632 RepID=A0ACB8FWE6_9SAUR
MTHNTFLVLNSTVIHNSNPPHPQKFANQKPKIRHTHTHTHRKKTITEDNKTKQGNKLPLKPTSCFHDHEEKSGGETSGETGKGRLEIFPNICRNNTKYRTERDTMNTFPPSHCTSDSSKHIFFSKL